MENDVIGLKVVDGKVAVVDLEQWLAERDAAAGEYLADALKTFLETGKDVSE